MGIAELGNNPSIDQSLWVTPFIFHMVIRLIIYLKLLIDKGSFKR